VQALWSSQGVPSGRAAQNGTHVMGMVAESGHIPSETVTVNVITPSALQVKVVLGEAGLVKVPPGTLAHA
jgi:hypothetical protein